MAELVRDFLQDQTGDLAVVNGDFAKVAGAAAVPQGCGIRARLFLGEVWTDQSQGVDYMGKILIKNPNPLTVRAEVGAALAATPDVISVIGTAPSIDAATRRGTISYSVQTIYSPNPVTQTTPAGVAGA